MGTLTALYLEKDGQIRKQKRENSVCLWPLTHAEVLATWAFSV